MNETIYIEMPGCKFYFVDVEERDTDIPDPDSDGVLEAVAVDDSVEIDDILIYDMARVGKFPLRKCFFIPDTF